MNLVLLLSCAVLFAVPLYFVVNSVYQDGVFGRGSLLGISFLSAAVLGETAFGNGFYAPPTIVLLIAAFAVFLSWHLARFELRIIRKRDQWKQPSQILKT